MPFHMPEWHSGKGVRAPLDNSSVKTLDRMVDVLDCFSPDHPSWSLAELSAHLRTPKSTLHRFMLGLETHGILRRDGDDRRWRLGYRLVIWGSLATDSNSLRDLARPVLQQLAEVSGETAILTVYSGRQVICLDLCETQQPVRLRMMIGDRRPLHAGASSKILTAFLPPTEIDGIIAEHGLPWLCSGTITDPQTLRAELARIAACGYAVSLEETDRDAWGVATPVRDWRGQVVAGVGLAGPSTRYSEAKVQQWVRLCSQASARIGKLLGEKRQSEIAAPEPIMSSVAEPALEV